MTLTSLLYLSNGNLPSQMAHTIQVAKMAQALAKQVKNFELVTGGDIASAYQGMDLDFQRWYGLHSPFKLVRIPLHLRVNTPFPADYTPKNYETLAVLYTCLKSPRLVYTRSTNIATILVQLGIPVVWEKHELIKKFLREDSAYRRLLTSNYLLGFVTLSSQTAQSYTQLGLDPKKVLIAHSGVDIQSFLPSQTKVSARQKLALPHQAKIVLYSGHLYDYKGIPTLIETARLMPECLFVLVGGWQADIDKVKGACQEQGSSNVQLIGHVQQSELATYLYAADILILPNTKQWQLAPTTSPLKLFEYMAVNRPIVASALPNIISVLRDRHNALLAQPDEPNSFRDAIATLLNHPSLAASIAQQAWQDVQNFTWDQRAERILSFAASQLENANVSTARFPKPLVKCLTRNFS